MKRKRKKKTESCGDSMEYGKKRRRMFSTKWQVGQPWLQHDHDGVGGKLLGECKLIRASAFLGLLA